MAFKIIVQDPPIQASLSGVAFSNCWDGVAAGANGTIITTNDGGTSWTSQTSGFEGGFRDTAFAGETRMVAVGDECKILMSDDGGTTWFAPTTAPSFPNPEKNLLAGVSFKDKQIGYAVGIAWDVDGVPKALVLTTDDSGDNWGSQFVLPESAVNFVDVDFTVMNGITYVVVVGGGTTGIGGLITRTEIGKTSWSIVPSQTPNELLGIGFAEGPYAQHGWAVGRKGTIVHTIDGGATWTAQTSGVPDEILLRVIAIDDKHAWAVGINGSLVATNDGGKSWIQQNTDGGQQLLDLAFCGPCRGTIVGGSGTILTVLNFSPINVSVIQSDFGSGKHKNLEAVVFNGRELWHWYRDNSSDGEWWLRGQRITGDRDLAAGAGAIIQSDFGSGDHKNFEVVVPLVAGGGRTELWHFFHDNSDVSLSWDRGQRITGDFDNVAGPACLIQSDFGSGDHKNFEIVVPLVAGDGRTELWHFVHDNSDVSLPWQRGQRITGDFDNVAGPACLIQSDFGSGDHKNFEVVVPLVAGDGRTELWHFYHDNSDVSLSWQRGQRITGDFDNVAGPACLIQSDFGSDDHKNYEVVVPLHLVDGVIEVRHFFHDNSDVNLPWQRGQFITQAAAGSACLISSDYGAGGHRNFEVIVEEFRGGIVHYWHPNDDVTYPWLRSTRFDMLTPLPPMGQPAEKVVQLTGEHDREGWDGTGQPPFAYNQTETNWGIIGADLGASFEHLNRVNFLFGDTWRVGHGGHNDDLDSVAFTAEEDAGRGLHLTFHPVPPIVSPPIPQDGFNVPLDGVSVNGTMYVFFSTDHFLAQGRDVMGRSVLTRSDDDGLTYQMLYEVSRWKFINISSSIVDAQQWGLPGEGPQLLIFGSGRYRSSDVYLAVKSVNTIEEAGGWLFYAGNPRQPNWSPLEDEALPLFPAGSVGELSVRFDPVWSAWLCLFNDDAPTSGIVARWAATPWGPWSDGRIIFTSADGHGKFIHKPGQDHTQEGFGADRSNDGGGVYGPYQISRYSRQIDAGTRLFFTLSVWNPYQTMLMSTVLPAKRW